MDLVRASNSIDYRSNGRASFPLAIHSSPFIFIFNFHSIFVSLTPFISFSLRIYRVEILLVLEIVLVQRQIESFLSKALFRFILRGHGGWN